MSTSVTYTKEAPMVTYQINIPASINLNGVDNFEITANSTNLSDNQSIVVTINAKTFDTSGSFYLTNNGLDKITTLLFRKKTIGGAGDILKPGDTVATFGSGATKASDYGVIYMNALYEDRVAVQPGTYSGTLYFDISLQ